MPAVYSTSGAVYPPQTIAINTGATNLQAAVYGLVTISQFKKALQANSVLQAVSDSIPADVTNEVNIEWFSGLSIISGDALYVFTKGVTGFDDAQMATLLAYAKTLQV